MKPIPQIHLIVRTVSGSRTAEVAACSYGVSSCDIDEITAWFNEDTAENLIQTRRPGLFFHPLPSGCSAWGRIMSFMSGTLKHPALAPHISAKGTFQVSVSIVPAETLLLYGNNPFALPFVLEEKLQNEGAEGVNPLIIPPEDIELFNESAVKKLCAALREYKTAEIIQDISDNISLLLTLPKTIPPLVFLQALFSLLPVRFRTELSFSTETHISSSHLFRLILVNENKRRTEDLSALSGVPHKIITEEIMGDGNQKNTTRSFDPYPQFIFQIIHGNSFDFLKRKLEEEYRYILSGQDNGENIISDWEMLHIPAVRYLEEINGNRTGSEPPSAGFADIESIKPLLRSTASAEHLIVLLKQESKHLTDLLTDIRKAK